MRQCCITKTYAHMASGPRSASALMQGRCPADRSRAATHRVFICKQFTFCLFDCLSNYIDLAFMTSSIPAVKNMIRPCLDLKLDANLVGVAAAKAGIWHLPHDMESAAQYVRSVD